MRRAQSLVTMAEMVPNLDAGGGDFQPRTFVQIGLAKAGDRDAFGDLLERYGCRVRAWLRQAAALSDHDLDELAQEVSLKIFQHLQRATFDEVGSFRAWVKTICRNTAANHRRRRGRDRVQRHLESIGAAGQPFEPAGNDRSPASQAHAHQAAAERDRRIAQLREQDQWLIAAREQRGLQFREIQAELNAKLGAAGTSVSEDAVRVKYHRLLKRIGEPE